MQQNNDVKMFYIEDDIEKIQTKTNLYIKQYGPAGAAHLCREIIQNSIDELMDENSHGSNILITYDTTVDKLTCEDDGRGFPETDYPLDIFCTKIQSGSKFFHDQSGSTSGEFGLGLTAVNALSASFSLESFRENEKSRHLITFENGQKTGDEKSTIKKGDKKHGCVVTFIPSRKYLGANTVIPVEELLEWVKLMAYQIPDEKKLTITFEIWKGLKLKSRDVIKSRPFAEMLDTLTTNKTYSPEVQIDCTTEWSEMSRVLELDKKGNPRSVEKEVKRDLHIEAAVRYIPEDITKYDTFCNFTNTIQGGVHQQAFDECWCRIVIAALKESMSPAMWDKYKPTWDDVRSGLCCVLNLTTSAEVGFVGNVKEKIDNQKLLPILKSCINPALKEYFAKNKKDLDDICKIVKTNSKARVDLQKVKEATQSERSDSMKEREMKNFYSCNNDKKNDFRELFIVEGNSASGSAVPASDRNTQAIFLLRGVGMNVFNASIAEVMENREWSDLRTVLRAGIGKNFDVNKCWYKRINILTDSDIDGYFISLMCLSFLYYYMRPLIENGMVYKVMAPLYRLSDKNHPYAITRSEITDIFFKNVKKQYKIELLKDGGFGNKGESLETLSGDSLYTFLDEINYYSEDLRLAADTFGKLDPKYMECCLALLAQVGGVSGTTTPEELDKILNDQKFIKSYMSRLQKFYPEVMLNGNLISGTVNGHLATLQINPRLINKTKRLFPVYMTYGYRVAVTPKNKDRRIVSISEFADLVSPCNPTINARFKGLGELNHDELRKTVFDINNRISIRYTLSDVERDLAIFEKLMSKKKLPAQLRKEMMMSYQIDREDLDN